MDRWQTAGDDDANGCCGQPARMGWGQDGGWHTWRSGGLVPRKTPGMRLTNGGGVVDRGVLRYRDMAVGSYFNRVPVARLCTPQRHLATAWD